MNFLHYERSLYDLEYIESNCTLPNYDSSTEVDTARSTAVTNYIIGVVGVLAAAYFMAKPPINWYWIAYLLLSAIGYTLAGVYHHVIDDTENVAGNALFYLSVALTVLALPFLEFTLTEKKWIRISIVLTNLVVVVVLVALLVYMVAPFWSLFSFFVIGVVYSRRRQWLAAMGSFLFVAGFLVMGLLAGSCAGEAQKDCYKDCPFPDPTTFNHHGVFHICAALGLLFQAIGEATSPTVLTGAVEKEENDGKAQEQPEKSNDGIDEEEAQQQPMETTV